MDVRERTAANRRRLADFFVALDDEQLATPSLCGAWTVRDVLGHVVEAMTGTLGRSLVALVAARGSLDRANAALARRAAQRPRDELVATLRAEATRNTTVPVVGQWGPFADSCLHLRDCARPLGLGADVALEDWKILLDRLPNGVPGLVPKSRAPGLALRASDQQWSHGQGAEVVGPSEALAMALAGRPAAVDDLSGAGAAILRTRLLVRR